MPPVPLHHSGNFRFIFLHCSKTSIWKQFPECVLQKCWVLTWIHIISDIKWCIEIPGWQNPLPRSQMEWVWALVHVLSFLPWDFRNVLGLTEAQFPASHSPSFPAIGQPFPDLVSAFWIFPCLSTSVSLLSTCLMENLQLVLPPFLDSQLGSLLPSLETTLFQNWHFWELERQDQDGRGVR